MNKLTAKLKQIYTSIPDARQRSKRLSLDHAMRLMVDGEVIPSSELSLAFESLSTQKIVYNKIDGRNKTSYFVKIDDHEIEYCKYENGDFDILFDGQFHCANGPARSCDGILYFYKSGMLHNPDGPAVAGEFSKHYYLNGKELSHHKWIEENPNATHYFGYHRDVSDNQYTVSRLGDYATINGSDGTVALLKKSELDTSSNIDDFLLDIVGTSLKGYHVLSYINVGRTIEPIYRYLQSDRGNWKTSINYSTSSISYDSVDGSYCEIKLNKYNGHVEYKIRLPNGEVFSDWIKIDGHNSLKSLFSKISVIRDSYGRLSAELLPAFSFDGENRYYISGFELSQDEFLNYSISSKCITFKNESGQIHRIGGPAMIKINSDGTVESKWFDNGIELKSNTERKLINLSESRVSTYSSTNSMNVAATDEMQSKFEEALKRVAKRTVRGDSLDKDFSGGDKMETKTVRYGMTDSAPSDSRTKQVSSGFKLGVKKGALRKVTQKAAEKITEVASQESNPVIGRVVELALLLGTAELVERLPDTAASKVGLNAVRREDFGGLARTVAGENLGRDAVDIVSFIAPMLLDKLQDVSADDINELVNAQELEALNVKS